MKEVELYNNGEIINPKGSSDVLEDFFSSKSLDATYGAYYWSNGKRASNSRYWSPDALIPCVNGETFIIDNALFGAIACCLVYDDGTSLNLSATDLVLLGVGTLDNNKYSYTISDENVKYVIFQNNVGSSTTNGFNLTIYSDRQKDKRIKKKYIEPYDFASKEYVDNAIGSGGANKDVDLIMFMGQSNMAGRGTASQAPLVKDGVAYEYKAITAPEILSKLEEPFGLNENVSGAINDGQDRKGSLVSAFVNACYAKTKRTIVAVCAARGAMDSTKWVGGSALTNDAINRFNKAVSYLQSNGYNIVNNLVVFLQGESDGDAGRSEDAYISNINSMWSALRTAGVQKLLFIRVGRASPSSLDAAYGVIMNAQNKMCKDNNDMVMLTTAAYDLRPKGMLKDRWHYTQLGYNYIGKLAGSACGDYLNSGHEPILYDGLNDNLFFTSNSN